VAVWRLILLISLGGTFEFLRPDDDAYIAPGLIKAGVFHAGKAGLFGLTDQATFAAATSAAGCSSARWSSRRSPTGCRPG